MQPNLASNSRSSCLSLLSTGIISAHYPITWLKLFLLFFSLLGIKPRALCTVDECSTTELHPQLNFSGM
jgi:hypothetical protein